MLHLWAWRQESRDVGKEVRLGWSILAIDSFQLVDRFLEAGGLCPIKSWQ